MWPAILAVLIAFVASRYFRGRLFADQEMLAIGAIVYVALPFVAFENNWLTEMPGVQSWRDLFKSAQDRRVAIAALFLAIAVAYLLGREMAGATAARLGSAMNRPLSRPIVGAAALGLWVIWAATAVTNRASFFQGYSIDYDTGLLGNLATINLLALAIVLSCRQYKRKGTGYRSLCGLLLVNSIALLSLGGRMYVIIPIVGILLQSLSATRSMQSRLRSFIGLVMVMSVLLVVGVVRIDADFSLDFIVYIGLAEGLFTSMSLGSFIENNGLPAWAVPFNFFGSIVNFVPSALLPNKAELIPTVQQAGLYFESPLGATHLYVALLGNFGWAGSLAFSAGLGWLLGAVRRVSPSGWWLYFYLCSLLPFMFFRDGFSIFNKAAFFNCVLLWLLYVFDRFLVAALRPLPAVPAAAAK